MLVAGGVGGTLPQFLSRGRILLSADLDDSIARRQQSHVVDDRSLFSPVQNLHSQFGSDQLCLGIELLDLV